MTFAVNQNIFRFQVSVDDSVLVHELNCKQQLCCVELGLFRIELLCLSDVEEHVASADVLHDEIKGPLLIDVAIQLHDER